MAQIDNQNIFSLLAEWKNVKIITINTRVPLDAEEVNSRPNSSSPPDSCALSRSLGVLLRKFIASNNDSNHCAIQWCQSWFSDYTRGRILAWVAKINKSFERSGRVRSWKNIFPSSVRLALMEFSSFCLLLKSWEAFSLAESCISSSPRVSLSVN